MDEGHVHFSPIEVLALQKESHGEYVDLMPELIDI